MSQQIFNDLWLQASSKEKRELLNQRFEGLKPVVVYLDDEAEAVEIFTSKCLELGLEAMVSTSPAELLEFIRLNKARVLLVISDFHMKGASGFEFREGVLGLNNEAPFYILSGDVNLSHALEAVKLKISGFLDKPFHKTAFVEILQAECDKWAVNLVEDYQMLKGFTEDVTNIIAEIEEGCLHLENEPNDRETVGRIFGLVHTIKGSSGFFEPRTLHLFGHAFEDILKLVQTGKLEVSTQLISSWLKACDIIKTLNEEFSSGVHLDHDVDTYKKIFDYSSTSTQTPQAGHVASSDPKSENRETKTKDIKVSMGVLDEFAQASGELTVIRNMINKVVSSIEKQYPVDKDVQVLGELLDELHKINSDIQTKITDIRRVPVSHLTKPLSRNLRDTCKALGKEVNFLVEGEDIRLDNAMADTLSRCLVHLMRNSLDHGLESNEERRKLGKPEKGNLLLRFETKNESVIVTIADDGRGINTDHIRKKVISQGMRSSEEANRMSDEELHLMIFESGFSTAAQITEFSGRGVGMSMVKETIEESKGKIKIFSEKQKGSRFTLEIPIPKSVQMINCLFVTSGSMSFGIPQEFVLRVIDQNGQGAAKIEKIGAEGFIRFDGNLVPVVSLASMLKLERVEGEPILVILETQGQIFALQVLNVLDAEDSVIKPLGLSSLISLATYLGITFIGDGTLGLVIDIPAISRKLGLKKSAGNLHAPLAVEIEHLHNVVSFHLDSQGTFAIPEEDVFRVEEVSMERPVWSGEYRILPYRESMMTLISLDQVLFDRKPAAESGALTHATIIVRHGDQYLGLMVKEIIDRVSVKMDVKPLLRNKPGVKGNLAHPDGTLVLIDISELRALLTRESDEDKKVEPMALAS